MYNLYFRILLIFYISSIIHLYNSPFDTTNITKKLYTNTIESINKYSYGKNEYDTTTNVYLIPNNNTHKK